MPPRNRQETKEPSTAAPAETSKPEASAAAAATADEVADKLKDLKVKDDSEQKKAEESKPSETGEKPAESSEAAAPHDVPTTAPGEKPAAEVDEKGKKRRCVIV
ncbi:hypothetical protein MTO96_010719 [Rhipicephalus appendiculatus]